MTMTMMKITIKIQMVECWDDAKDGEFVSCPHSHHSLLTVIAVFASAFFIPLFIVQRIALYILLRIHFKHSQMQSYLEQYEYCCELRVYANHSSSDAFIVRFHAVLKNVYVLLV